MKQYILIYETGELVKDSYGRVLIFKDNSENMYFDNLSMEKRSLDDLTIKQREIIQQFFNDRLELLHTCLEFCSNKLISKRRYFTLEERILINQERGCIFRKDYTYMQSEKLEKKIQHLLKFVVNGKVQ